MPNLINVTGAVGGKPEQLGSSTMWKVKAGTTESIKPGYLVIEDNGNAGYVKAAANGYDSSVSKVIGIASSTSTETASADGFLPSVTTAAKLIVTLYATTPASLTQAMRLAGVKYALDVSGGSYTLDQGTTSNGIFKLVNFDSSSTSPTYGLCTCVLNTEL